MNISNWIYHYTWVSSLKKRRDCPFINKIEADAIKSNCVLEIHNSTSEPWLSLKGLRERLGTKTLQNIRARTVRDAFKTCIYLPDPVYSNTELAKIRSKFWMYLFYILCLTAGEAFLYKLVVVLFMPDTSAAAQYGASIVIALVVMLCLSFGIGKHFKWREAVDRRAKGEISENHLKSFIDWRIMGYVIFVVTLMSVLIIGIVRIHMLEHIDGRGLTPEKLQSVTKGSRWGSYFTFFFTTAMSVVMAILKLQFNKYLRLYMTSQGWHRALIKRNRYTQTLLKNCELIILIVEQKLNKYLQLIIDLKRTLGHQHEHDEKDAALNGEYVQLRAQSGFVLTEAVYLKYNAIQCAHPELFEFGVIQERSIREKLAFARIVQEVVREHLAEHMRAGGMRSTSAENTKQNRSRKNKNK